MAVDVVILELLAESIYDSAGRELKYANRTL